MRGTWEVVLVCSLAGVLLPVVVGLAPRWATLPLLTLFPPLLPTGAGPVPSSPRSTARGPSRDAEHVSGGRDEPTEDIRDMQSIHWCRLYALIFFRARCSARQGRWEENRARLCACVTLPATVGPTEALHLEVKNRGAGIPPA